MSIIYNGQTVAGVYTEQVLNNADTINAGIIKIATQEEVNAGENNTSAVTPLYLSNKQNKLESGDNISIENDIISCDIKPDISTIIQNEDGTLTNIGQLTKSGTIKIDWEGTQAEYNVAYLNGTIQPDWYCYITDDEEIVDYGDIANQSLSNLRPEGEARFTAKADTDLSNLTEEGADKLNTSKMYLTGSVSEDEQGYSQLKQMKRSTFDLSKFTVVGSPTITEDGVASGFSNGNYLTKSGLPSFSKNNSFKVIGSFKTGSVLSSGTVWARGGYSCLLKYTDTGHLDFNVNTGTYSYRVQNAITTNTEYNYECIYDGESKIGTLKYKVKGNANWNTYIKDFSNSPDFTHSQDFTFGYSQGGSDNLGSIDLKQFSITGDGKEVFSGNKTGLDVINEIEIPYTLSKTGSKIVDVAYRDRVIDLYEQEGKAKYYTIDEENKNFTLPMGEIYGMIGNIKNTKSGGSGLELCDISMALYVDETKGLRRYLNGQIVDINTNTQAFLNRLKEITTLHPSLLCTEDEWQTAKTMSAFGQVGKFVFNYSGDEVVSVRIPRVVNIQGLFDLQNLGLTVGAGLPNIIGTIGSRDSEASVTSGAFKMTSTHGSGTYGYSGTATIKTEFNASYSNPIYGNSNTVQQEAIQYPYFIQIATGAETENNIVNDIELNNPYSLFDSKYSDHELNNLSWLKSEGQWNAKAVYPTAYDKLLKVYNGTEIVEGLSVKLSTETYTDYDFVLNTANETFRLPLKNHTTDDSIEGLTLYYYVGETVQNANLIDAGRIGEQLANHAAQVHIIETYVNGTSWYRVYSDGWCEQGGFYTINTNGQGSVSLLKSYRDTSYHVLLGKISTDASNWNVMLTGATTSTFNIQANLTGYTLNASWGAKGYIY